MIKTSLHISASEIIWLDVCYYGYYHVSSRLYRWVYQDYMHMSQSSNCSPSVAGVYQSGLVVSHVKGTGGSYKEFM